MYLPDGDLPAERVRVAGITAGGFLHVKGVVEALYAALKAEPSFERTQHPLLHPGKAARTQAGVVGELHPRLLEGEWGAFELDLADLIAESRDPVTYADVITYPAVRQDIAVSVPEEVAAGDLVAAAREAAGPELREIRVFDVYRGEQVGEGRKSVAFSVAFQSPERTLSKRMRRVSATRSSRRSPPPSAPNYVEACPAYRGCERLRVLVRPSFEAVGLRGPTLEGGPDVFAR